jgi:hypothetical protein
MLAKRYEN